MLWISIGCQHGLPLRGGPSSAAIVHARWTDQEDVQGSDCQLLRLLICDWKISSHVSSMQGRGSAASASHLRLEDLLKREFHATPRQQRLLPIHKGAQQDQHIRLPLPADRQQRCQGLVVNVRAGGEGPGGHHHAHPGRPCTAIIAVVKSSHMLQAGMRPSMSRCISRLPE